MCTCLHRLHALTLCILLCIPLPSLIHLVSRISLADFDKREAFNYKVTIRAPPGATPLDLLEQAKQAARLPDLLARVTSVNGGGGERAVPQCDELRCGTSCDWDPGD